MRFFKSLFLLFALSIVVSAQTRQQAIDKFNDLKNQAKGLEKIILPPDKEDVEKAKLEKVSVFRILPREIYDKQLFETRGSGSFYSFYFKIPDYGYGSDLKFEQNTFSVSNTGLMIDLGEVSLNDITKESPSADALVNYQDTRSSNSVYRDFSQFRYEGLKSNGLVFKNYLPAVTGHTYVLRSLNEGYYDVLVAFKIERKDADGSLIIFWKLLDQLETPKRENAQKAQLSDEEILKGMKSWAFADKFSNIQIEVNNGVVSLRGAIAKEHLAHAVEFTNRYGASKVINLLTVK